MTTETAATEPTETAATETPEAAATETEAPRMTSAAMFYKIILGEVAQELDDLTALREQAVLTPSVQADIIDRIAAVKGRAVHTATLCQSAIEVANAQIHAIITGMNKPQPDGDAVSAITRLRDAMKTGR